MTIELFGSRTSPYVRHARTALLESSLDWDFKLADAVAAQTGSPLMRVPYLVDGSLKLTDSAVIIRYIREQSGQPYLPTLEDHELFCTATTVLDSAVNVFLLQVSDGLRPDTVNNNIEIVPGGKFLVNRQQARIEEGLRYLDTLQLPAEPPYTDGQLRLACLLGWGLFRERFTLDGLPNLNDFLSGINQYPAFADTAPIV